MKWKIPKSFRKTAIFRKDLWSILNSANPNASLSEQIEFLDEIVDWVRIPTKPEGEVSPTQQIQSARVKFLLMILDRTPELRKKVSACLSQILIDSHSVVLFSEVGINREHGFFAEAIDRSLRKVLPFPSDETDLSELFVNVFSAEDDANWVAQLDDSVVLSIFNLLTYNEETKAIVVERIYGAIRSSIMALGAQATAIGISPEVRFRSQVRKVRESAFIELSRRSNAIFDQELTQGWLDGTTSIVHQCQLELAKAMSHLNRYSVSISLVYRLELLEQTLERILTLIELLRTDQSHTTHWKYLISELVRTRFESTKVSSLVRNNLHLLARKIVERTGVSGERYIARTMREYTQMLASAAGGGVLTAGTTIFKFLIGGLSAAPLIEGLLLWLNYSGSFLFMQKLHFTLATKQPSMTAPALAAKLKSLRNNKEIYDFINEVRYLTRSQFAAAIGNVGLVIPTALACDWIWRQVYGAPVLNAVYSMKAIKSLSPIDSFTIPFAALTGVVLWASSMLAGWTENWIMYRRIPEALEQSGSPAKSTWVLRNVSGFFGSIYLGMFLAFIPVWGSFSGLPLDVRHVTLSTGSLPFAISSLGIQNVPTADLVKAGIGILIIGLLNFGVSFALALYTAVRARAIRNNRGSKIRSKLLFALRKAPLSFIIPTRSS